MTVTSRPAFGALCHEAGATSSLLQHGGPLGNEASSIVKAPLTRLERQKHWFHEMLASRLLFTAEAGAALSDLTQNGADPEIADEEPASTQYSSYHRSA